jgi:hypothetical protein
MHLAGDWRSLHGFPRVLNRPYSDLRSRVEIQFVEDVCNVPDSSPLCDHQAFSNFAVGTAADNQRYYLAFAVRQRVNNCAPLL